MSMFPNRQTTTLTQFYYVLDPIHGELTQFRAQKDYYSQNVKQSIVIRLKEVMAVWGPTQKKELKGKGLHSIEVNFFNESVLILALYDGAHISQWLRYL
jgi:hypothetical protein